MGSHTWAFNLNICIYPWPIVKNKVKVVHILIENSSKIVKIGQIDQSFILGLKIARK